MRLYIRCCERCEKKVYLNVVFSSRISLRQRYSNELVTIHCSNCNHINVKSVYDVHAEVDSKVTIVCGLFGCVLVSALGNFIFPWVGLIFNSFCGLCMGVMAGYSIDRKRQSDVDYFNNS